VSRKAMRVNEDEVRRIVREEIAEWERNRMAEMAPSFTEELEAMRDWREKLEPDPSDDAIRGEE
jgi:hypothetical protein